MIILNPKNFYKEITQRDKAAFVHFYSEEHKDDDWEEMEGRFKSVVFLGSFNCDEEENWNYAKELGVEKLPSIRVFP